jgi:hypothetical protein
MDGCINVGVTTWAFYRGWGHKLFLLQEASQGASQRALKVFEVDKRFLYSVSSSVFNH